MSSVMIQDDCLEVMRTMPDDTVDLVFTSPPYEAARTYGIDFNLKGQDWVDWIVERTLEMVRVSRGLVAIVVEGRTRNFRYSATPLLMGADLHRAGVHLRKPPAFHRVGIPGSGGPDWLRNDWEFIICCTSGGKLPWSDNVAMGHPPKYAPGGAMSNRNADGRRKNKRDNPEAVRARRNQWGETAGSTGERRPDGSRGKPGRPSHTFATRGAKDGDTQTPKGYTPPKNANPGNVIHYAVGGGVMGDRLCHENEAPFPERLAEFFIRSFCPPGGVVLDPFCGSGTTAAVAKRFGRHSRSIDIRKSQIELTKKRLGGVQVELF